MNSPPNFPQIVDKINETLPVHALWDGFWIHKFKRSNLVISGSQDQTYYRNYDLVFKKVLFFNLPRAWRDTNVLGDHMLRLSDREEFARHHPGFDVQDRQIFAIDLHYDVEGQWQKHTFFVVAAHVYLFKCEPPDDAPGLFYTDPLGDVWYPCKENRVV